MVELGAREGRSPWLPNEACLRVPGVLVPCRQGPAPKRPALPYQPVPTPPLTLSPNPDISRIGREPRQGQGHWTDPASGATSGAGPGLGPRVKVPDLCTKVTLPILRPQVRNGPQGRAWRILRRSPGDPDTRPGEQSRMLQEGWGPGKSVSV